MCRRYVVVSVPFRADIDLLLCELEHKWKFNIRRSRVLMEKSGLILEKENTTRNFGGQFEMLFKCRQCVLRKRPCTRQTNISNSHPIILYNSLHYAKYRSSLFHTPTKYTSRVIDKLYSIYFISHQMDSTIM